MTRKIIILGATGSIGESAVDVVLSHPDNFKVVALAARSSKERCEELGRRLGAKVYLGEDSALKAVEENEADMCLVATVGMSGPKPTIAAIDKGMDIALAT
jgi:1-deoxy-D-xylulose-5-phosphate reductoisomerase